MRKTPTPIRFAGSQLREMRHACAFFNGDDEAFRVLFPFMQDGFARGDKIIHIVNPGERCRHSHRLRMAGIDTTTAEQSGQLEFRTNTEAYLRDGRFDQERMLDVFETLASGNAESGFPLSRIVCHMDWASEVRSHIDDLVEFEARVNDVWSRHDDAVICVYDLAKFGGDTVVDIMRTHPMIVIGGILQQNPFFMPPEDFLRELRQRRLVQVSPDKTTS
ncbi:MEDS domain-containing protein [Mesorhizobium opportunistum]|uniref:MEDS domain-containing protein n=1 Tax=Mesorhizobium opportunistum TaxID=593909 RepID=A0ABV1YIW0_9HYPH